MKHVFLLLPALALAGRVAAQTTPAPTPAAPNSANWYIFDQPLPPESQPAPDRGSRPLPANKPATVAPARRQGELFGSDRPAAAAPAGVPAPARTRRAREFQGALYVPLNVDTYRLLDRYAIQYGPDSTQDPHTSTRPYTRGAAASLGERVLLEGAGRLSAADRFNAQYLLQDNWLYSPLGDSLNVSRRPLLKYFYRDQTDFYHTQTHDFQLRVNPVLGLQAGVDRGENSLSGLRYVNTRGVSFEGLIDRRLGFYGFFTDNQEYVPGWVQQRSLQISPQAPFVPYVAHEGYAKPFGTRAGGYDFFTARGGVTYAATRHINVQLAHDRNFIGNGYRSLILSDFAAPYFFIKLNTRVWKFNYQNLFAELTARRSLDGLDSLFAKKYLALHHLSFDVTRNFNVGLFEAEVSGGRGRGLELQYFNPVIFYRAIEQNVGSTDNALLGLDFKWNIAHRGQLYGQLVLDEFKLSEVRSGNGWWANKQAVQLGGKLLDVGGLRNLDLQVEFNYIRPYTYQHASSYTDYQHYQQPLAHPMGANLTEVLAVLSYQPLPHLSLVAKGFYVRQGLDYAYAADGQLSTGAPFYVPGAAGPLVLSRYPLNLGGNPLLPYNSPPRPLNMDYGNRTGQGNHSHLLHLDLTATYQPKLNVFVDATLIVRRQTLDAPTYYGTVAGTELYPNVSLRWNIAQRLHEF